MEIDTHTDLETKAGIPLNAVVAQDELMRAFEALKEANDERLNKRDNRHRRQFAVNRLRRFCRAI